MYEQYIEFRKFINIKSVLDHYEDSEKLHKIFKGCVINFNILSKLEDRINKRIGNNQTS